MCVWRRGWLVAWIIAAHAQCLYTRRCGAEARELGWEASTPVSPKVVYWSAL